MILLIKRSSIRLSVNLFFFYWHFFNNHWADLNQTCQKASSNTVIFYQIFATIHEYIDNQNRIINERSKYTTIVMIHDTKINRELDLSATIFKILIKTMLSTHKPTSFLNYIQLNHFWNMLWQNGIHSISCLLQSSEGTDSTSIGLFFIICTNSQSFKQDTDLASVHYVNNARGMCLLSFVKFTGKCSFPS